MKDIFKKWGKDNIKLSKSKVKSLLKRYCGFSYKKKVIFNAGKATDYHIELRETWIRLYLSLSNKYCS